MERLKNPKSYWFIGYLIPYNKPQRRYGNFSCLSDIIVETTLNCMPNDYIFRRSSSGIDYIYYRLNLKREWERLSEVIEYDSDIIYPEIKYLK